MQNTLQRVGISTAAVVALLLSLAPNAATAASITVTQTVPTWSNVVGGDNVNTTSSGGGNNKVTQVFWGDPAGFSGQSGLGFNPTNPPAGTYAVDQTFELGTLYHYNQPIYNAASSVQLNLATTISSAVPAAQTFAYQFNIDETPNTGPVSACAYPSVTPCADKITFVNLDTTNAFTIGGVSYTIALLGFSADGTNISSSFISQENMTNSIGLYAKITGATPTAVPEPASLALLGVGLCGIGYVRRKKLQSEA